MNEPKDMAFKPKSKRLSPIWIFPILALLIGGWLIIKAYNESGVRVHIQFQDGNGITPSQTKVIYKGLPIGAVEKTQLSENLKTIDVTVKLEKSTKPLLRTNTKFWLVKPEISLAGISGLETILSGNYIGIHPGDGEERKEFVALNTPPSTTADLPGLHLRLVTTSLGSLHQGAPVYYHRIQIGEVSQYKLASDDNNIFVDIYIQPEYKYLIHKNSRFWNASGISISGGITGFNIRTESLVSVLTVALA